METYYKYQCVWAELHWEVDKDFGCASHNHQQCWFKTTTDSSCKHFIDIDSAEGQKIYFEALKKKDLIKIEEKQFKNKKRELCVGLKPWQGEAKPW